MKRMKSTVLLSVAALLAAGSAFANTTIKDGVTGDGSLILDVTDTTSQTSFMFDTGKTISSFNGNSNLSYDLSTDPNWVAFAATIASGDTVTYNVVGVDTVSSTNPQNFTLDGTSNAPAGTSSGSLGSIYNSQLKQISAVNSFISAVNNSTSATSNSLFATAAANKPAYAGSSFSLGTEKVTAGDVIGTAQGFYQWTLNGTQNLTKANLATFAGQWNLTNGGALTYIASTPLPPGLTLLLSGMALTALIARRRTSGTGSVSMGAAA